MNDEEREFAGLRFEWSAIKGQQNEHKHGVTFDEAITVFSDSRAGINSDTRHSEREERWIIVGHSLRGRLLLVSYTDRDPRVRVITARQHRGAKQMSTDNDKIDEFDDDLPDEVDFSNALPNKFADRFPADTIAVVLAPDVARVFRDAKSVNEALRLLIRTSESAREHAVAP